MTIKEGARIGKIDEISDVIGSHAYYMKYYFPELKQICLGPYQKGLVGVSRFYPMLDIPTVDDVGNPLPKRASVVVDFEPAKLDGPMFLEEKRKFFMEQGIVYIPIFLTELLTKEEFAARFEEERINLARGFREALEDEALDVEIPMYPDEALVAQVNTLALEAVKKLGLRGAAKINRLRREKERILGEMSNARLGSSKRTITAPLPTGGSPV